MTAAAEAAARVGFMLTRPRRSVVDGLEILQELGGSASVGEVLAHVDASHWSNAYQRFDTLVRRGLAEVVEGRPRRYRLTKAGRLLAKNAAY